MKEDQQPSSVVCTNTLELGIDIGQLDLVVQINSTHSVSAFAQRLGRSGRRIGSPRTMQMYSIEKTPEPGDPFFDSIPFSMLQALAVVDLFQERWVEPPHIGRQAYNVLYHQMLSYLAELNGVKASRLVGFFLKSGVFPDVTADDYETLLRHFVRTGQLQQMETGELLPGLEGEKVLRSREFYAVFQSPPEWAVVHRTRHLGNISPPTIDLQIGEDILLSGRVWRIVDILPRSKKYMVEPAPDARRTHFSPSGAPDIHPRVAQKMREILFRDDMPAFLSSDGRIALSESRKLASQLGLDRALGFDFEGEVVVIPWTGTRAMAALFLLFKNAGCNPSRDGMWVIRLKDISSLEKLKPILESFAGQPLQIADVISEPQADRKFDEYLPETLIRNREGREQLDFEEAMRVINELHKCIE
jgi:ATP-dependent Lhr-like helicase